MYNPSAGEAETRESQLTGILDKTVSYSLAKTLSQETVRRAAERHLLLNLGLQMHTWKGIPAQTEAHIDT